MTYSKVVSAIEHGLAGAILVTIPLLINSIPMSWQNMTVGAVIGIVWGIVRGSLSGVSS